MTLFRSFQRLFTRAVLPVLALLQSGPGAFALGGLLLSGTVKADRVFVNGNALLENL